MISVQFHHKVCAYEFQFFHACLHAGVRYSVENDSFDLITLMAPEYLNLIKSGLEDEFE